MRKRLHDDNPTNFNKHKLWEKVTFEGNYADGFGKLTGTIIGFSDPSQNAAYIFRPDDKQYSIFLIGEEEIVETN